LTASIPKTPQNVECIDSIVVKAEEEVVAVIAVVVVVAVV